MESIIIKPLTELFEFVEAIEVQRLVWNRTDYSLIPPTIFKSFSKNGGSVIGALTELEDGTTKVIGYAIGFLASNADGMLYHHSQQVAVLPEYQQLGIAYKLKEAQKDFVKSHYNLTVMTWTVDPLLSKNAFLNYHKLGAIGRLYWANYYGFREDTLNSGLETDRIEVEWYFSEPEQSMIASVKKNLPNDFPCFDYSESGDYLNINFENNPFIGTCIPRDLVKTKEKNLKLATNLRINFRNLSQTLIKNGYIIVDVKSKVEPKSIVIWTNTLQNLKKLK